MPAPINTLFPGLFKNPPGSWIYLRTHCKS